MIVIYNDILRISCHAHSARSVLYTFFVCFYIRCHGRAISIKIDLVKDSKHSYIDIPICEKGEEESTNKLQGKV